MASHASIASSAPDQRQLRLIAASAQANVARVRDILAEEPQWTSHNDRDALRQSLQKVAARGNVKVARLLLEHGAEVNTRRENEVPALVKAAEGGHGAVVAEILRHGADLSWRNKNGLTVVFLAAVRGHLEVLRLLLEAGADIEARDREGRTPLLYLSSEKPGKWKMDILKLLVDKGANIDARDRIGRTPLLWAATTSNIKLVEALLSGELGKTADILAANNRGRTALHLAAEANHEEMVRLLLTRGADPSAISDGGWTALHNAAQNGHVGTAQLLLQANAKVNSELSNGMTPLHWAAFNGHVEVVKLILAKPETDLTIKDSFDRTPMLCAAERYHRDIIHLLSPARSAHRLRPVVEAACKGFEATVVDFSNPTSSFRDDKKQVVFKHSVFDLLYGWDDDNNRPTIQTVTKNIKYQPAFRWIHLPANNIAWVETLLAKHFIEGGSRDIEAYKALERCFDQEHRGPMAHAHFMRTFCQRVSAPHAADREEREREKSLAALAALSEETSEISTQSTQVTAGDSTPRRVPSETGTENDTPKSETKKKSKSEQLAERHPRRTKRAHGPPGNPPGTKEARNAVRFPPSLPWDVSKAISPTGKLVLFMPFLHYETDERRDKMSTTIRKVQRGQELGEKSSRDQLLIEAYMNNDPPLHPRRTLDQFFYHGIDTSERDRDQVIYRYCKAHEMEKKVFMVDQLWMWVFGKDLVITCFPQRWDQPKLDPLNVLDGIIEETNAKTRPPVQSVYDLVMLITSRCSGLFDRHRLDDQNYQFLDMFESSIGNVTIQESELFSRFNRASALSSKWLRRHRGDSDDQDSRIFDALLDIRIETALLTEIKDIRDELNIIAVILASQQSILEEFELHMIDELRPEHNSTTPKRVTDALVYEIRTRGRAQRRLLEVHRKDIDRMDKQAESIYISLTHLLDLKQKHSNALEARFARDQAVTAAKQGQSILVFTIVTIIFLPASFIAAFFAIEFADWAPENGDPLTIRRASPYIFGIGLAISIPLIFLAFTVDDIFATTRRLASGFTRDGTIATYLRRHRQRRKGALLSGGEPDDSDEDVLALPKLDTYLSKGRPSRPSLADDGWRKRATLDLPSPILRTSYDPNHLSPTLRPTMAPRKVSVGSGNAISWARPSLGDRGRSIRSDDLERGRATSSARGY